jgi:hypothetical protein
MRYKIQKSDFFHINPATRLSIILTEYYVLYEKKLWWKKSLVWRNCKEWKYDSFDGHTNFCNVKRSSLEDAEYYIKSEMLKRDLEEIVPIDVKIYECRDQKIDRILNEK